VCSDPAGPRTDTPLAPAAVSMDQFENPIVTFEDEATSTNPSTPPSSTKRSLRQKKFTRAEAKRAFKSVDENDSGELDYEEVQDVLKMLGQTEAAAKVKADWHMLDVNGDGETGAGCLAPPPRAHTHANAHARALVRAALVSVQSL
jgi:hypothetical protein